MLNHWFISPNHISSSDNDGLFSSQVENIHAMTNKKERLRLGFVTNGDFKTLRNDLYNLQSLAHDPAIIDLGKFRNTDTQFMIQALRELISAGIIPILIGFEQNFQEIMDLVLGEEYQTAIITSNTRVVPTKNRKIDLIGAQRHRTQIGSSLYGEVIPLGIIKNNVRQAEAHIRDKDAVIVDLRVLKRTEILDQHDCFPSGLTTETLCQLCRYAGFNPSLKILTIIGFNCPDSLIQSRIVSDLVWYFSEANSKKLNEVPDKSVMKEIVVQSRNEEIYTFVKSETTGRIWLDLNDFNGNGKSHYLPCTKEEFDEMCGQNIPDRIMKHLMA